MSGDYHGARLSHDARRTTLWSALWRHFFSKRIAPDATVLDLGAGHGDFINSVVARRRIAIDTWPAMPAHVAPGVEAITGSVEQLDMLADGSIDYAFASNLFEHLPQAALIAILRQLEAKLSPRGELTILQPNYRYAAREYFDDYTHVTVYSHVGLADLLTAHGWTVTEVRPRFLPMTIKSRLPVSPLLIRLYLASPVKPMGKQMLLVARPGARA